VLRIAAQLYTLREFTKTAKGFADALAICHEIGYEGVQLSAVGSMDGERPEVSAREARDLLDENGLECCATHRPFLNFVENIENEVEFHRVLRCDYTAIGGIWNGHSPEAYRAFLNEAAPIVATLKRQGIRFGYHNHDHEFIRDAHTKVRGFDVLADHGGQDLMMEIDTFWIAAAGASPVYWLERCSGRIPVIHVKDGEVVPEVGHVMAPVGEGNQDWRGILEACRLGGTEWLVVEQDVCRRDPFECLASSYDFLSQLVNEG
jgi:sugar phosphate isomerase/epimerase